MIDVDIREWRIGPFRIGQSFEATGTLLQAIRERIGASRWIDLHIEEGVEVTVAVDLGDTAARCRVIWGSAGRPGDVMLLGSPLSQWTLRRLRARLADLGIRVEHEEDGWAYLSDGSVLDTFAEEVCSITFSEDEELPPRCAAVVRDAEVIDALARALSSGGGHL
jgi:hypothetical protein